MNTPFKPNSRRNWLLTALGLSAATLSPWLAHADNDENEDFEHEVNSNVSLALAQTGVSGHVVVIGGGMAGATAAKYLRLWGGAQLNVTLVDTDASYTSNIMSNLVLTQQRTMASLDYKRDVLASSYGVNLVQDRVINLDTVNKQVVLANGAPLTYDRVVAAPGVEFMAAYGLSVNDYNTKTPHAWRAGAQTTLLADQIARMANGDSFVMTIPLAPYRCPPGPYERACVVADLLKRTGRSNCRVVILDENANIQAESGTFQNAFDFVHAGVIAYQSNARNIQIDPDTKVVTYAIANGATQTITAKVVNPIPAHRAAGIGAGSLDTNDTEGWFAKAGLNNSNGRWALVNPLSYESTAIQNVHVIGDAAQCGLPKAGHVGNQEGKICADAIIRLLGGGSPDTAPVANSACYSPITSSTASWLTAVYQYDASLMQMKVASNGGLTAGGAAVESATISSRNYTQMGVWFHTLMKDTFV
jgi:sulfide dehydrogenase [flavocytochrome c] flavoprotein chain